MLTSTLDDVHAYWFGPLPAFDSFPMDKFPLWFGGDEAVDREVTARFGGALEAAGKAEIDVAGLTSSQQVGLVVLLDQLSRNIHRNAPAAYALDQLARSHAATAIANGFERFKLVERVFVILPFGHSEMLADQDRALSAYLDDIAPFAPEGHRFYEACRIQAQKYRDIIARFGRFPHRNAVLGRATTAEEAQFMAETRMMPF